MTVGRPARTIHVVAGVVIDRHRRMLIAQRPAGKQMAGAWEFPGGKLEPGEARAQGLRRELQEEIGITIGQPRPLVRLRHSYPHAEVLLDVWVVRRYRGEPRGLDGQELRWCNRAALAAAELLPADRPIQKLLRLPETLRRRETPLYGMCEPHGRARGAECPAGAPERVWGAFCRGADEAEAAAARADFLAMRAVLGAGEIAALCERVAIPVFVRGMTLERAWALGASGINAIP